MTPLTKSIIKGELLETIKLLDGGADINEKDGDGNTLVYYFTKYGCNEALVDELISRGIKLDKKNGLGQTPLMAGIKG